jgi:membrane protein implicated in regulation of membrane protease activity
MKSLVTLMIALTLVLGFGEDASAYIGPGAGLSMLGAFWGLVVAVLAALSFLLLWPIRKAFKKNASTAEADANEKPAS